MVPRVLEESDGSRFRVRGRNLGEMSGNRVLKKQTLFKGRQLFVGPVDAGRGRRVRTKRGFAVVLRVHRQRLRAALS